MNYHAAINSPVGKIGIQADAAGLAKIDFLAPSAELMEPQNATAKEVIKQLQRYFSDPKAKFDLPLILTGTTLQQKIWRTLPTITAGSTLTYGALGTQLATHARVIGNACRCNPVPIIIPCHRVVGKASLGGYSGETRGDWLKIKEGLLRHEGWVGDG